jgi:activator of HSP90 ATPase
VRNVHHRTRFAAPADRIYHALMNASEHALFTGYPAQIDAQVGGKFATCGDRNLGFHIELVPNRRIVQAWRHKDWPDGTWSTATFQLSPAGAATDLDFTQTGVPSECWWWIDSGWKQTYWLGLDRWLRNS